MVFENELIQYAAQTIAKQDKEYYKQLLQYFHELPIERLLNEICEYTDLCMSQITDRNYIINNVLPKIKDWT